MTRDSGHVNTCPEPPFFSFQQEDEGLRTRRNASRGSLPPSFYTLETHLRVSRAFFPSFFGSTPRDASLRLECFLFLLLFYSPSRRVYTSRWFFFFLFCSTLPRGFLFFLSFYKDSRRV